MEQQPSVLKEIRQHGSIVPIRWEKALLNLKAERVKKWQMRKYPPKE